MNKVNLGNFLVSVYVPLLECILSSTTDVVIFLHIQLVWSWTATDKYSSYFAILSDWAVFIITKLNISWTLLLEGSWGSTFARYMLNGGIRWQQAVLFGGNKRWRAITVINPSKWQRIVEIPVWNANSSYSLSTCQIQRSLLSSRWPRSPILTRVLPRPWRSSIKTIKPARSYVSEVYSNREGRQCLW